MREANLSEARVRALISAAEFVLAGELDRDLFPRSVARPLQAASTRLKIMLRDTEEKEEGR